MLGLWAPWRLIFRIMLLGHTKREGAGLQQEGCGSDFWKDFLRSYEIYETRGLVGELASFSGR